MASDEIPADTMSGQDGAPEAEAAPEAVSPSKGRRISRRALLIGGAAGIAAVPTLGVIAGLAWAPNRGTPSTHATLPNIQFDVADYSSPATTVDGVLVRFAPVFTLFLTAQLSRIPTRGDQAALRDALDTIEAHYPFGPSGIFTVIAYGIPYFNRLPGGMDGALVSHHMPRLLSDPTRYALEEAMPGPTDVSPRNPDIVKKRFNLPVSIEANDLVLTLRSDSAEILQDVEEWLGGSGRLRGERVPSPPFRGLFTFTSRRVMFQQMGLPRRVAARYGLSYSGRVNPRGTMWMGFADQQVNASGPARITTFLGNASAHLTSAAPDDYFSDGAIQHLSHIILDLTQFYGDADDPGEVGEPYTERVSYMFRATPLPSPGNADQFSDGGGPAFLENTFQGTADAARGAAGDTFDHLPRLGHLSTLQRSSRAADGTPIHIRMDGPGFDALDIPDGTLQPKLHFSIFVPTADFFAQLRHHQASLDLAKAHGVSERKNGLERFLTATRRQNYLVPPRAHRAFPLLELL